ncbi:protein adenylyltransferase SelO family protein [Photobacterium leiognathi]|uniref:protein adenylyltransferase SelO family protein n=1 Tax=Photobacterium leiognathi TaxID=553611 RepID=UPI0029812520|nr:protein adenylyltransferase SelO family protein [Photobacterium leiognathi]
MISSLPDISFADFETFKLKNAEILWINNSLIKEYEFFNDIENIEEYILDNYSFVTEEYINPSRILKNDSKIYGADRYGSRHEVCNGGSARCGYDGLWQVKGIGITPLLSQNMSKTHANGKLFLDEAISEAIWGEVCHRHLPYGAIRTLAIIKTNVTEEFLYLDDKPRKPCALAIREFSVRPAHFERSTFFWPFQENMALRDNDAERVKKSIQHLPTLFKSEDDNKISPFECIEKIVSVMAEQIAYSRIKGIPHGSLTSSNISIDGRFLDFGTITAVPDFGNYVLSDGVGAVWDDHELIKKWIFNLSLTINKYSDSDDKVCNEKIINLCGLFSKKLDYYENVALLKELNIKTINSFSICIASDIKKELVSNERMTLSNFNDSKFRSEIKLLAKNKGLDTEGGDFFLRNFKYSSFSILNNDFLKKSNYSRESIEKLIDSFCM